MEPLPRAILNPRWRPADVPPPSDVAAAFHQGLPGYAPTPVRSREIQAAGLHLEWVGLKDESSRLELPAFKVLGASWAIECALRERPEVDTLVAASAGNHGRAVAHVAAMRGLRARIFLPARSAPARRAAIEAEGAEVVVIDGTYEEAVALAAAAGSLPGAIEIADVGTSRPAHDVIDGYQTLFAEAAVQARFDLLLVPVGVGSLAAAAARFGAAQGVPVIGVEPVTAACLTASLAAGEPTPVANPGTSMAGLDCAEISITAWPVLRDGITGMVTVDDEETAAAMRELAHDGLWIGDCGAAPSAALERLATDPAAAPLREAVGLGPDSRVLLIATEGVTDPDAHRRSGARPQVGGRLEAVDGEARAIWDTLREAAQAARANAHAPYSRFAVGAAVEADSGEIFAGCNVENAAYPQTICAERNAVSTAATAGVRRLRRVYVIADPAAAPCGGCRSVLAEFGSADTEVMVGDPAGGERLVTLGELLPQSFEMSTRLPD